MEKQACKKTEEALAEIYRNAQLALQSISNILPAVEDATLKDILSHQHESYEHFSARASILARDMGIELKDPNPMKKMMMWGSIKMSTMKDKSRSHIAEMMVQGSTMDVTDLLQKVSVYEKCPECKNSVSLAKEVVAFEEKNIEKMKEFL